MVEEQFHRDVEGRPIREGRTPPALLRDGEIEYRACPYAGSRFQHPNPMNVSALRQMSAHWDTIADAVGVLRAGYTRARGGYRPELWELWRVSQLGSALPWFFILHEREVCPVYAASLSKVTLGMGIWAQKAFVDAMRARTPLGTWTSAAILASTEANGTLIADTEVCAGSEKMLLRFFDLLVDAAGPAGSLVPALAAREAEWLRFGAHYVAFKQWLWLYWLARRFLYEDVAAATGTRPDELATLLDPEAEPPDFFLLEPGPLAAIAPPQRALWFRTLAAFVVPFAPDGSDAVHARHALRLAEIMGTASGEGVPRAVAQFTALDALLGEVAADVEAGFGGQGAFGPAERDRLLRDPPRAWFARLATAA